MREGVIVARQIARNVRAGVRLPAAADLASGSELAPDAAAAYADSAHGTFVRDGGLTAERLGGARMVEVGPGDSLALGLRMLAAGAREVVAVDRFPVLADRERQGTVYRALMKQLSDDERRRAQVALDDGSDPPLDRARLRLLAGVGVEDAADALEPESFDVAYSVAALQHSASPEAALRSLDRLLAPGGLMLHQVDLGDLGVFTGHGMHPLTFLTVPERRYRWMGSNLGISNRALIDRYRSTLASLGYEVDVRVTKTFDADEASIEEIRPRMLSRYRELPLSDLLVESAMIVARKPGRV